MVEFIGFYLSIGAVVSAFEVAVGIDAAFEAAYTRLRHGENKAVYDQIKSGWGLSEDRFKCRMKTISIVFTLPMIMILWPVFLLLAALSGEV